MKKWILGFIILISLASSSKAQVFEAPFCPTGTQPFANTRNPQTGNFKSYMCIDSSGNVTFIGGQTGAQTNVQNNFTVPQTFSADIISRGPNPFGVDVRAFNVRAININVIPLTNCDITINNFTASCLSSTNFQKNDSIAIVGAGAPHSLTTPTAPVITPSCASTQIGTGGTVPVPGAATTYNYQASLYDFAHGLTSASPTGTTNTGNATLGERTLTITSITPSASGNTLTFLVNSTAELATNCGIHVSGTTDDQEYSGDFIVKTVTDGTHFTADTNMDSSQSPGFTNATATGGTVFYWLCNDIALPTPSAGGHQYIIWGRVSGSMTRIGTSVIASLGYTDPFYNHYQDFGSPMQDHQPTCWWCPSTPNGSPTSDMLRTIITNIVGNNLTLANSAGTTVSAAASQFDNGPNLETAVTNVVTNGVGGGGTLRFPAITNDAFGDNCYLFSSNTNLSNSRIIQDGQVCAAATIKNQGEWFGTVMDSIRLNNPSQGIASYVPILCVGANPCYWTTGAGMSNVTMKAQTNSNGAIGLFVTGNNGPQIFNNLNLDSQNLNDYQSINFYKYMPQSGGFGMFSSNIACTAGPAQTIGLTNAPCWLDKYDTLINVDGIWGNRRGYTIFAHASGVSGSFHMGGEVQGIITPILTMSSTVVGNISGFFEIRGTFQDTSAGAVLANLSSATTTLSPNMTISGSNIPGGAGPVITGQRFGGTILFTGINITTQTPSQLGRNINLCMIGSSNSFNAGIQCSNFYLANMFASRTIPTLSPASSFNTGTISNVNGTLEFTVTIGVGAANSTGTISLPTAINQWHCSAENQTRAALITQTGNTTTSSTLTNFGTTFAATNWTNGDILHVRCGAK